jgi:manganese-dependent inorganic pyrophosphatase
MQSNGCLAVSYPNPDADGTVTALAYATVFRDQHLGGCRAGYLGDLNEETKAILQFCDLEAPELLLDVPDNCELVLVDTHHLAQLPPGFPASNVILIIDHHPAGDNDRFRSAEIVNEEVGAAATLLFERAVGHGFAIPAMVARALAGAIVSNTLEFAAPTTTVRDHAAFGELARLGGWRESYLLLMREARAKLGQGSLRDVLRRDIKAFEIGRRRVVISQLEIPSADEVLSQGDLLECLEDIARDQAVESVVLNVVDLGKKVSALVVTSEALRHVFQNSLGVSFDGPFARVDRILLRKSDLVPALQSAGWEKE